MSQPQPKRILIIEIRTLDNPGFDSSQLSTIEFSETTDKYQVNLNYQQIGSAIRKNCLRNQI